jgi:RNA polymerase sigma-70 factor (ECF subfamily)
MGLDQQTVVQVLLRERIRITASVMPMLRDSHAADDVFQQVVVQALEDRERFREPEHVRAWALRVARHRAIDQLSKRGTQCLDAGVLDLLEQHWVSAPADELAARVEALQRCMGKLPGHARELLRLRYEDGLRCAAVASRLRRTVDAVYQSLSRVHRQLRQCVERELQAIEPPSLPEALS